MPYPESNRNNETSPGTGILGIALSVIGLTVAGIWLFRSNNRNDSASGSGHTGRWLLGILGAGIAGAMYGSGRRASADGRGRHGHPKDVHLESDITISRPPEAVYRFWKDFRNLPSIMSFIDRVEPQEGDVYRWIARAPAGLELEWDAEIVDDVPGRLLAWRSLEGSDIQTWGTVVFHPRNNGLGTKVRVAFNFSPPDSPVGSAARFLADLESAALDRNLRNLKAELESGDVPAHSQLGEGSSIPLLKALSDSEAGDRSH